MKKKYILLLLAAVFLFIGIGLKIKIASVSSAFSTACDTLLTLFEEKKIKDYRRLPPLSHSQTLPFFVSLCDSFATKEITVIQPLTHISLQEAIDGLEEENSKNSDVFFRKLAALYADYFSFLGDVSLVDWTVAESLSVSPNQLATAVAFFIDFPEQSNFCKSGFYGITLSKDGKGMLLILDQHDSQNGDIAWRRVTAFVFIYEESAHRLHCRKFVLYLSN